MKAKFENFWCRLDGRSSKFTRLRKLEDLPPEEQLFCALLRLDHACASQIISNNHPEELAAKILEIGKRSGFSYLIYSKLSELQFSEFLRLPLENSTLGGRLSRLSSIVASGRKVIDRQFAELLDQFADERKNLLWIKGVHLSRTVYPEASMRFYGDLDVIVNPSILSDFLKKLETTGFEHFGGAEYSNQLGAGPSAKFEDLFLAPLNELIPTSALTLKRQGMPLLDIKAGPLDRGLQPIDMQRFFDSAEIATCLGRKYHAPCKIDHLMIILRNLEKDRFANWKALVDIHFLCEHIHRQNSNDWEAFIARCQREGIQTGAWAGLMLAKNRFNSVIPDMVLLKIAPDKFSHLPFTAFTVSSNFVWNSNSLPMLIINAVASHDRIRKLKLLLKLVLPSREFLSAYYQHNKRLPAWNYPGILMLHWLTIICPAGLVRTTFGKKIWPSP